eukprot:CAMPEP_0118705416 /NCGR_PEP_ID=MMETSP0800-20121206/19855_1 /TAXON_ID=210618 ORGANISM="Striatella unipunctata, Strain CCMP2910" /NCGR_SAMPLE_ID=MMETSP0800 /ASSEMBLY_ACC=CAM_ASM_000638 /LENGTH=681 /DNA_ID=CAMNT_0006607567 /DNA_START=192 /DNA_END=2238 /DNA_ORIENTATION=-
MTFKESDWMLLGRGIPRAVILKLFASVLSPHPERGEPDPSIAEPIIESLEIMNLLQKSRHGVCVIDETEDDEEPTLTRVRNPSYVMHESLKAIAEDMVQRPSLSFRPGMDEFTAFVKEIEEEERGDVAPLWSAPLRAAKLLALPFFGSLDDGMEEFQFHEVIVMSLTGGPTSNDNPAHALVDSVEEKLASVPSTFEGQEFSEYFVTFVPGHLIRANSYYNASVLLLDANFIDDALKHLEPSKGRGLNDLVDLRREVLKTKSTKPLRNQTRTSSVAQLSLADGANSLTNSPVPDDELSDNDETSLDRIDTTAVMRDGSRRVIDEVYRVINKTSASSLNLAICLSSVGDALLKSRHSRDAMLRLEEAVGIFRGLLGPYHIDVARALHSVAKALVKLGETRVALLKFNEATRIFEACNAASHYDSISTIQDTASLLVDTGEWGKAQSKYEDVISLKTRVHGASSIPVAKAINTYAIILAKHGKMDEALSQYEDAKKTYASLSFESILDPDAASKSRYDITLINLNIASIRSKKGDIAGAIESYEEGVRGLRQHQKESMEKDESDPSKATAHQKHLVAAMGRIGSLKLKQGDNQGALDVYLALLDEVTDGSPSSMKTEKAKAHIKCATIFRQIDGEQAQKLAVSHLRQALDMYTVLFGTEHKDTLAISASLKQWLAEERTGDFQS